MTQSTESDRGAFEAWLGIKPCGAAHDLAWAAWQAARRAIAAPQPQADARDAELVAAVVYASAEAMNSSIESPSFDGSIVLEPDHAASLSLALDELEHHRAAIAAAKENKR